MLSDSTLLRSHSPDFGWHRAQITRLQRCSRRFASGASIQPERRQASNQWPRRSPGHRDSARRDRVGGVHRGYLAKIRKMGRGGCRFFDLVTLAKSTFENYFFVKSFLSELKSLMQDLTAGARASNAFTNVVNLCLVMFISAISFPVSYCLVLGMANTFAVQAQDILSGEMFI
jgi:hypothetical protein